MGQTSTLRILPREIREIIYGFALDVDPGTPPVLLVDEMLCAVAKLQPSERAFIPDRVIYREIVSFNIEHSLVRLEMIHNWGSGSGFNVDHDYPSFGVISPLALAALRNVRVEIPGYPVSADEWLLREEEKDHQFGGAEATGLMLILEAIFKSLSKAPNFKSLCFFFLDAITSVWYAPTNSRKKWNEALSTIKSVYLAECLAGFPQLKSFGFRGIIDDRASLIDHSRRHDDTCDEEGRTIAGESEICSACLNACMYFNAFEKCFFERPRLQCKLEYFSMVWSAEEGMRLLETEDER